MAQAKGNKNTAAVVEQLVRPIIEELGLKLWDVRFEKEGPDWYLRVLIDNDGVMDTDTCAEVSHAIDPVLDSADPIDSSYYLEVGSPGLGRRLTRPEHFEACLGAAVLVHTIRPITGDQRDFRGTLKGLLPGGAVSLQTEEGADMEIASDNISYVKLCDDDDLFA